MSVTKNLNVPFHGAAGPLLDGAAAAQMILDQIGTAVDQITLDSTIQSNNVEPTLWHSDPEGMKGTLNFYKPAGFGGYFVNYAKTTALEGSEKITYTLQRYEVATATLVFWGGMWLVVKGVQTDVDPLAGNPYTIEGFWIHNPWEPSGSATGEYITYNPTWLTTYFTPISVQSSTTGQASQWSGQFVSICDPELPKLGPQALHPPKLAARGEQLIERSDVVRLAQDHVKAHDLVQEESFRRALEQAQPGEPELVHRLDIPHSFDYLVPFLRGQAVTAVLRVDGRFGYLQQALSYADGVRFPRITWDEVRQRLAQEVLEVTEWIAQEGCLGQCFPDKYQVFKGMFCLYPALVWVPCWESRSPFYPFYMVSIGSDRFYISSLDGAVYRRLHPFGPTGPQRPGGL